MYKKYSLFNIIPLIIILIHHAEGNIGLSSKSKGDSGIVVNNVHSKEVKEEAIKNVQYEPTWESLDSRPLPAWYDSVKIGIFIHWGVFSVPSFGSEWFWQNWMIGRENYVKFMNKNYPPNFTYQDFGPQFRAEFYDPVGWAQLFEKSGAKYVVLTSKHHEGYTLWPSKYSFGWNAMQVGPKRDLLGDLASAIRSNSTLKFGLYHSLFEWFNPLWVNDKENNFTTDEFVRFKTLPGLYEIVNEYKPEIVWSDGEWDAPDTYWKSKEFLAWLYNESPVKSTVVTNDRWGHETLCKHGGYYTCADRYNPGVLQPHKWENCMTLDKLSWGYRRSATIEDYLTPQDLITTLVTTIACGGNLLVNIGPTMEGTLPPIMEERLLQMGEWLELNGEAIYDSNPHSVQNDSLTSDVWYTRKAAENKIYAMVLFWPKERVLELGSVNPLMVNYIELLGSKGKLNWEPMLINERSNKVDTGHTYDNGITVYFPSKDENPSEWAWTLCIHTL